MNRFSVCPDPRTVTTCSNTCHYNLVVVFVASRWRLQNKTVTNVMKVTPDLSEGAMLSKAPKKQPIVAVALLQKISVGLVRIFDSSKNKIFFYRGL